MTVFISILEGEDFLSSPSRGIAMFDFNKNQRKGFTLIELLVVIAIITLLISILLPSLKKAQELAKGAVCASNLRNLGTAYALYCNDSEGILPSSVIRINGVEYSWWFIIRDYIDNNPKVVACPSQSYSAVAWNPLLKEWSYGYNRTMEYLKVENLSKNPVLIADGTWQITSAREAAARGYWVYLIWNYGDGKLYSGGVYKAHLNDNVNLLFVAGNVNAIKFDDLDDDMFDKPR